MRGTNRKSTPSDAMAKTSYSSGGRRRGLYRPVTVIGLNGEGTKKSGLICAVTDAT